MADDYRVDGDQDVWAAYCRILHESDVQAFGIADYFSIDGYTETTARYKSLYGDSKKVFFPNIELRTNEVVNQAGEHVNVHLLFNPSQKDCVEQMRKFLGLLETNKTQTGGRHLTAIELTAKAHFEEATVTKKAIEDALKAVYGPQADLTEFVLVVTAANNDGIRADSKGSGVKRKALISDELDKISDGFFGSTVNVEWFLGTGRYVQDAASKPKPTLSGCDAHSFEKLATHLGKVVHDKDGIAYLPTWIKADVNFEGLKQIIFEPENRVFIGEEPEVELRVRAHKDKYIDSLYISSVDGYGGRCGSWFDKEEIHFGKELVAIIGNKGSGKSAIADVIGLLGNTRNQHLDDEELFSFITKSKFRKGNCAANFRAKLRWHVGPPDEKALNTDTSDKLPEKVEYLPQKYLERICANIADDEFRSTLNEVIFGYVKEEDRYEQRTFDDLIAYLTQQANVDIAARRRDLHLANDKVVAIEKRLSGDYLTEIEGKITTRERELESHASVKPAEKPKPDTASSLTNADVEAIQKLSQEIDALNVSEAQLREELASNKKSQADLKRVRAAIESAAGTLTSLRRTHNDVLTGAGLSFEKIVALTIDYAPLDDLIATNERRIAEIGRLVVTAEEIDVAMPDATQRAAALAGSIVCQRAALAEKKAALADTLEAPQREYQAFLDAMASWSVHETELRGNASDPAADSLNGLVQERSNIQTLYPTQLAKARAARDDIARDIFRRTLALTSFYDSVKKSIDGEISKHRRELEGYDISIEAGLRFDPSFHTTFFKFVSQQVKGTFSGAEDGKTALVRLCDVVESWDKQEDVFQAIGAIIDALHIDKREDHSGAVRDVFKQIKNNQTLVALYDYLYGFEYLAAKYDLMVDKKDLSELSPGERGGLLLIFYLMLDRQDIPLVIDQPEDNLDNESVYRILATFLKKAKKRRQIIMVTHNPNLAVGADAEQIIRVSIDKTQGRNDFSYYSGAIEADNINRAVVDILEGTLPAFDNRRLKYRRK